MSTDHSGVRPVKTDTVRLALRLVSELKTGQGFLAFSDYYSPEITIALNTLGPDAVECISVYLDGISDSELLKISEQIYFGHSGIQAKINDLFRAVFRDMLKDRGKSGT